VDFGGAFWVVILVGVVVIVALLAGRTGMFQRDSKPMEVAPERRAPEVASNRMSARLAALHGAGRTPELIRQLDQTLPEWVVAGSLVETARELAALDASIVRARELGVSEEVTGRLSEQSAGVATDLWALAERMVAAEQTGSREMRVELEQQDASLVRLSDGMREAREELLQLSLGGAGGADDLGRAERRFRSLAATAREIHEWERERLP
jgi:hypothetical protein